MNPQKTRLTLTVLMLIIVSTVVLAWLGILPRDETMAAFDHQQGAVSSIDHSNIPSEESDPAEAAVPLSTENLTQISIASGEPITVAENSLQKWPSESTLPEIRTADLLIYQNRAKSEDALAGITVFLDPGHGGQDSGATYPAHAIKPQINESEVNLAVAIKTRQELEALGATVYLLRNEEVWQSIFYRVAFANLQILERFEKDLAAAGYYLPDVDQYKADMNQIMTLNSDADSDGGRGIMSGVGSSVDLRTLLDIGRQYPDVLYLSIHCNALEDNDPTGGLQVFYLNDTTAYRLENEFAQKNENIALSHPVYQLYDNSERARLANLLLNGILDQIPELKYPGQSDVQTENFAVLRELNVTSALIELGFLSSPEDRAILMNDDQRQKMAQAIADAVYQFYCS